MWVEVGIVLVFGGGKLIGGYEGVFWDVGCI